MSTAWARSTYKISEPKEIAVKILYTQYVKCFKFENMDQENS
jgi:hypothetical protein